MDGFICLLGVIALVMYVLLPLATYAAVKSLVRRVDSLESAVRDLLRASNPAHPVRPAQAEARPAGQPAVAAASAAPAKVPPQEAAQPLVKPLPAPVPAQQPLVKPPPAPHAAPTRAPSVDAAGVRVLRRMWSWLVVGEEFRRPGVSAEFAIATTWLVRVGVLSGVLAVGFGLQLSIARGLLGPAGRVSLALLAGAAFILLGLRCLSRRYEMLGQGLVGGGLAMFYFAFFAASMRFHLMPLTYAFGCMGAVTASATLLALRMDALSVAVFGVLGGYATPLMLRSPNPDLPMFYAYLMILAVGIAAVAARRQWPVLTWLSLLGNGALFIGAAGSRCGWRPGEGTVTEVIYLCAFFALFSTSQFLYAVRRREPSTPVEMAALFVNALITLGGGSLLIGYGPGQRVWLALFALALSAFYVAHVWGFLLRVRVDRGLVSCFIALALVFLGLALPLLLSGRVLSAVLALHAVALLWLARRLESRMLMLGALVFYAVVLARLTFGLLGSDLFAGADAGSYWAGLRGRVVALGVPIAALFGGWRLIVRTPSPAKAGFHDDAMKAGAGFGAAWSLFAAAFYACLIFMVTREVLTVAHAYVPSFRWAAVTVAWAFLCGHLLDCRKHLSEGVFTTLLALALAAVLAQWLFLGWPGASWPVVDELRHAGACTARTVLPRLLATVACVSVLLGARRAVAGESGCAGVGRAALLAALGAAFLYVTFEAATVSTAFVPGFRRWAVSVVWICFGLGLLVGGLRCGVRWLRLTGLALFSVTVAKVLLVDLAGSDMLYRLIAFCVVGGVLLLAAYAYLRSQDVFRDARAGGREER